MEQRASGIKVGILFANGAGQVQPVHRAGQDDIAQHQIEFPAIEGVQGSSGVADLSRFAPAAARTKSTWWRIAVPTVA